MTAAVILPSPLLPPRAYTPLGDALERRGWNVAVATPPRRPDAPGPVLAAFRRCVDDARPHVVLAHSNAGRYAVAVAGGAAVVYVDAALPPEEGDSTLAPEDLLEHLGSMTDEDGLLPPWTRWWPEEDLASVLPDADALGAIRAEEQRLPLAYFRARLGAPAGWTAAPQAYLALGDTYAVELATARRLGWPTAAIDGARHLHHLVEPDAVAAVVVLLAAGLGVGTVRSAPGPAGRTRA